MEFPNDALVNYIFPNNAHVVWSLMIVIYPFITGLIAGAFVVSGFYHVFNLKEFKPISNLALVAAFCFALFAATPLLVHLGQPQRAFEIYFTPHLTSPMSMFGYVYGSYVILLAIEVWFVYRAHFVRKANETKGFEKRIWTALTLGVTTYHPHSAKLDERIIHFLALIGIPWACLLHGYVGFVFGSVCTPSSNGGGRNRTTTPWSRSSSPSCGAFSFWTGRWRCSSCSTSGSGRITSGQRSGRSWRGR
jgi:predicted membrane protein